MYGLFAILSLLWIPLLGLVIAACVSMVVRAVSPPPGLGRGAACGGCGYEIIDASTGRCSECGGDFLKVGVLSRRAMLQHRGSGFQLVVGWTTLCALFGYAAVWGAVAVVGFSTFGGGLSGYRVAAQQSFAPVQSSASSPGATRVDFALDVETDGFGAASSGSATVTLHALSGEATAELDVETGDFVIKDASGQEARRGSTFLEPDALALFETAGLDISDAAVAEEARQLAIMLEEALDSPDLAGDAADFAAARLSAPSVFQATTGNVSYPARSAPQALMDPATIVVLAVGGISLIIYVVGLGWLLRRRRRLLLGR